MLQGKILRGGNLRGELSSEGELSGVERERGGWHSNRSSAHCHKCLDFIPDDPKTESGGKKMCPVTYGGALRLISP